MQLTRIVLAVVALVALGGAASLAPAADVASRTVDRTFVCSPKTFGSVGDLDFYVTPRRDLGTYGRYGTHLIVRTGGFNPADSLVLVRARPQDKVGGWLAGVAAGAPGVYVNSRRCVPSRASVPLGPRGLQGPPVKWFKELDCPVRGRVLVHVRSVLRSPGDWRRVDRSFDGVKRPVVQGRLAVRNQRTGEAIAYMELDEKGRTNLWYSAGCR